MIPMLILAFASAAVGQPAEAVGKRPYEMEWANRTQDDHPPLVDFEDLTGWRVEAPNSVARFERTREQQIWGSYVGKLTYRRAAEGPCPVRILAPEPMAIEGPFDAVSCWIYGNNWGYAPNPTTPQVAIYALLEDAQGQEMPVYLATVNWDYWYLCWRRLTPEQIARVAKGGRFLGFLVDGGRNTDDRTLFFDNLAVFTEAFPPLTFEPRPERGVPMFPGETTGTNTGPGKLPFPTRPETILPPNLTPGARTSVAADGKAWVFTYKGADGTLTYRLEPKTGTWSDVTAAWAGRGRAFKPCADGGVTLDVGGQATAPDRAQYLGTARKGETVVSRWRVSAGDASAEVTYTYRLWSKSLVVDVFAAGGKVSEVRFGHAEGLENPRLVTNPFYLYTWGTGRPAVAVSGPPDRPLYVTGHIDWYLSGAATLSATPAVDGAKVTYQGGTQYIPKTDGKRNDVYERFFITVSPEYEEVLPAIPNPKSPYMKVTGTHLWRAHGASDRDADKAFWAECHRYGMTQVIITDHETGWRDGGESFTYRTRTAPGKGGDQGQYDYARFMQDKLGFVYGPYNNYTDFAPVNEFWTPDLITRTPDNQLMGAWMRCYAPKAARAVEYCEMLAPKIQEKFHFSTAYCDVHTAVAPWDRTDYDARVPGAGTFAAVFYSYGEIMLLQKAAWGGPVYSEGNHHCFYCGLTDGNYGQDQGYGFAHNPWLVDFDLRRMHDLCCNFGMGASDMFYANAIPRADTLEERDAIWDRFFAATVAFGHPGFLTYDGGTRTALRSYYMLQQLGCRYCLASAREIRYADAQGKLWPTSEAIARGVHGRSQVVVRYSDGTVTAANGSATERMKVDAFGHKVDLLPLGYAGWTAEGDIEVISGDPRGHRCDYSVSPAYVYVDGRGRFMRFPKAASAGAAACRNLGGGKYEVIAFEGVDCGFAVDTSSAVALDKEGKEIGPAELRTSRGLTYVVPVKGAFSYVLTAGPVSTGTPLTCDRDEVVAGEVVTVRGAGEQQLEIPADAKPGDRIWHQVGGSWIDFTVVPLATVDVSLKGNDLVVDATSNLARRADAELTVGDRRQTLALEPGRKAEARVDLGPPQAEDAELLAIGLAVGPMRMSIERGLRTALGYLPGGELPGKWTSGMCMRGGQETPDFGKTGAHVMDGPISCGDVQKQAIAMHPPWQIGVGYSFLVYEPMRLPDRPVAFRAVVGKGDGSDPGDGILYKAAVVDAAGKETVAGQHTVTAHRWEPIEADLTPWAGQTVSLKLITDCGPADNSAGDWGCWAEMRLEGVERHLVRTLDLSGESYRREPGPFEIAGLTTDDLRAARQGWLHYDGSGLEGGNGEYGSAAVLNGVFLGGMAPAGGNEAAGIWVEKVSVPLTPEAIKTLGRHNTFELRNTADWFKVRRFWIELELADGRKCSSEISAGTWTQPPGWPYAEGVLVPFGQNITVDIWFRQ